jgi:hypothetical protein
MCPARQSARFKLDTDAAAVTAADNTTSVAAAAPTLTTLVNFNGPNGNGPDAGQIADTAGDRLGTTSQGRANGDGTVFEIAKTGSGYASPPTTLVSFNGTNGRLPYVGLIADASGDLFETTGGGGSDNDGTVFEIANHHGLD